MEVYTNTVNKRLTTLVVIMIKTTMILLLKIISTIVMAIIRYKTCMLYGHYMRRATIHI